MTESDIRGKTMSKNAGTILDNISALIDYLLDMKYDVHGTGQDDYVDNLVMGLKHVRRMLRRQAGGCKAKFKN